MNALISQTLTRMEALPEDQKERLFREFSEQVEKALIVRLLKQTEEEGGRIPASEVFTELKTDLA